MDTAFVSFMKANTDYYLHLTCLKGLLSFRLDELDMNCIPSRTYQKMLQLDLLAELLPFCRFYARFWSQESHGGRCCGLHRASRVMLHGLLCWETYPWVNTSVSPGFLDSLAKTSKACWSFNKVVKRLNQNNHQTESMTFWWIPLDKPL